MTTRRQVIKIICTLPLALSIGRISRAQDGGPDIEQLKAGYAKRLKRILAAGGLPYLDIESSCNSTKVDIDAVVQRMDRLNIGLMALSADIGKKQYARGERFDDLATRLQAAYPDRFIPVGNGGQPPALTEAPDEFLDAQETAARKKQMIFFGEFEFRHYPSPRQVKRGETDRDVHVPIDGPVGRRIFEMSARTGLPFQIHYEIEDALLTPLENMLEQHPKARVIWCHLAQIRYKERASRYSAAYVDTLISRFPNLYFDTAFGDADSVYPLSNQRHARVWDAGGGLRPEWRDLIAAHPQRFLSALARLPAETRHQVAYRSAWSLLFNEEFA